MKICFGEESHPKILVIGSYSIDNEWEDDVIKGFKKIIRDDVVTKIEFIDSKYYYGDINYELLVNFLNSKYANGGVDYILTIDDEAFNLARKFLFTEGSFSYKKPIIFAGVNNNIKLSTEEEEYITGILEYQNNLLNINTIIKLNKNIDNIYILRDNSIFSRVTFESFKKLA